MGRPTYLNKVFVKNKVYEKMKKMEKDNKIKEDGVWNYVWSINYVKNKKNLFIFMVLKFKLKYEFLFFELINAVNKFYKSSCSQYRSICNMLVTEPQHK